MLLAGLTLATALWSGVQALNTQARGAYATAAALVSEDGAPRLDSATGQLPQARFVELRRAGVLVSPVVEGRVMLGDARVTLLGIDPLTAPPGTAAALADGDLQGFLSGDGFAHPETLAEIGATDIALSASQAVPVGTVLVDIGTAQDALGMAGQISHLFADRPRAANHARRAAPEPARSGRGTGRADRQLSPESDRVRRAGLCGGAVHCAFRRWAGVRATPRPVFAPCAALACRCAR